MAARPLSSGRRGLAVALAAALAGCEPPADPADVEPPVTCISIGGVWDVEIDLDGQVCHQAWTLAQTGCDLAIPAELPCPLCFMASPLCHGGAGQAPREVMGLFDVAWSFQSGCAYVAELEARSDGTTLVGSIAVRQEYAAGGGCPGFLRFYGVGGTRP